MAHASSRRGREAGDEAHHRLGDLGLDEFGRFFFRVAADFADHDDTLGGVIGLETLQAVDEVGPVDRVAADADAGGLAQTGKGQGVDGFVGQGSGAGDHADLSGHVNRCGHDADLTLPGSDDAGAVGTDEAHGFVFDVILHPHHVHHRDSLGNADDQGYAGIGGLHDGVGGKGRGHENHAGGRAGCLYGARHRIENGNLVHLLAALAGRHTGHDLGTVLNACTGMELTFLPGNSLDQQFGIFID